MSQLKSDLTNRVHERLHLWIDDSVDLFLMAGLSERDGLQAVLSQLIQSLVAACMVFDIPPEKLSLFITEIINRRKARGE